MAGRTQTLPWWLEGEGVKTTENKIYWPRCAKLNNMWCKSYFYLGCDEENIIFQTTAILHQQKNTPFNTSKQVQYIYRGRILGRNWDKSLKSFFLLAFHSHLYKRSLHPPVCNCIGKLQVWEHSRLCPETSTKFYVHEFGFSLHRILVYILYSSDQSVCPFVGIGSPLPLPLPHKQVLLHPETRSLAGEEVGGPNSDERTDHRVYRV